MFLLVALVLGDMVLASPSQASAYLRCEYAAHRGYHAHATENSLRAFRAAVYRKANYLEMDVQVTSDGRFVLMHDETINRTSHGSGRIINKTFDQLQRVRLNDGQHIPTLGSVLSMAQPTKANVLLELKWIPDSRFDQLMRRIDEFGVSRVVVHSFDMSAVSRFHAAYPDVPSGVDTGQPISVADAVAYGGVLPNYRYVTNAWLSDLRAAGVPTFLFTVNSTRAWRRFKGRVTMIITDRAAAYQRYRHRACA